jgi:ParB/RepB/Spo0J family partition protein
VVKPLTLADLKAGFRKDAVYEIPVSWFDLDDKTFATRSNIPQEEIDSMSEAIESQGQLEPTKARVDQTKDKLQIVMGWTRTYGCQKIGRTVLTMLTDADARTCKAWALAENMVRNEVSGWDQARKTIELLEEDFPIEEVGKILGDVSKGHVYAIKNIFKFPLIVEALKTGRIKISDAIHLANRTSSKDISDELQGKAILAFEAGTLKRSDLDYFLDRKGEMPAGPTSSAENPTGPKEKGTAKPKKGKTEKDEAALYFQKFTDGKILFNAKAVPGKTDIKELKKIRAAVIQFTQALEKIISKTK